MIDNEALARIEALTKRVEVLEAESKRTHMWRLRLRQVIIMALGALEELEGFARSIVPRRKRGKK